ncbi:MAG: hypothetical protein JW953_06755 [Anaerolineae bacterium]|nr:hypothetical protein [Anaerolineae bacterium]
MDLLKKIETLMNATARAGLPGRRRRSALDKHEERLLAEIREALAAVETQERLLAKRIKMEHAQAEEAAQLGDRAEQRAHQRRATELERELEQESIQAIDLEQKLQALEEKLALAKEAVEKQYDLAGAMEEEAAKTMAQGGSETETDAPTAADAAEEKVTPADFPNDDPNTAARKSRLSG